MNRTFFVILCLPLLGSCGYYLEGSREQITISVPYVGGDFEGELTDAIISSLSRSGYFRFVHDECGQWILYARIINTDNNRIGYRYDRNDKSGKLRKNIVGVENRKTLDVEISVVSGVTGKCVLGPEIVRSEAEYDYVDDNSLKDLSFIDSFGVRQTSIAFSLGQLDSVGTAGEDALAPLFRRAARKIVDGLIASLDSDEE